MILKDALEIVEQAAGDASSGLPEEVFRTLTRLTPMINVDLLIKDLRGRTLLTWRADSWFPAGWHIPGGIIRFEEPVAHRIAEVARLELKATVEFEPEILSVNEFILPELPFRNHFISLLYRCNLTSAPPTLLRYETGIPKARQYAWFEKPPENLLRVHSIYKKFI